MKYLLIVLLCAVGSGRVFGQTADDFSKNENHQKFIERIAGQWKLEKIIDAEKKDASAKKDPEAANDLDGAQSNHSMQMIEFYDNARYKMNNATSAIDSGSYRLNEQHGILYMQSDLVDSPPTEWKIAIDSDALSLTGRSGEADSRYRYVYERTKDAAARK